MKKKVVSLGLALIMLASLGLTGCQKKEAPIAADKVAEVIFDMMLKNDASSAVELFGYASEEEAREDMGLEGDIYEGMADEIVSGFKAQGIPVSSEDAQAFLDAFISMFKCVEMTAKVTESNEKEGTAVVTCTISTFDPDALNDAVNGAMTELMSDPSIMNSTDVEAVFGAVLTAVAESIADLEPSDETADFDVDFELGVLEVNGKEKKAWLPADAAKFGELVSTTALGGLA